ncbi:toll/interleukin-1 receptor domain-containing protein [Schinkia azotoformans]|uniref:toll/interleukin-1 receptor domain-containing protein n=1 Tax=Schinkia azotoformans TaxID=1454 RepID=UPI002DBAA679|nr:toll/interleukin-1 receptor domain-containing protein [Schinkia azotoformans]MEC1714700.1 toll/interleukin-1 receptor domain-containing protein [Schinkia azotoformans]MEC1757544.1 toll/interleukin-1 receptor domain-containing protein [Schinkia azotoformans]
MSISTIQSNIRRAKTKITDLRKKLYKEQEAEGKTRKEILHIQKGISRTTSQSMLKNKLTKVNRLNQALVKAAKEQSTLNKRIVDEEKRLHRYEEQLLREETRELKRQMILQEQRNREHDVNQKKLFDELTAYKTAIEVHTEVLTNKETDEEIYDVFISHASEDKDDFVRPLAEILTENGVDVWYDEYKLTWGRPTRRSIDKGLAKCRFGIVVFSHDFFRKGWTNYELDGLVSRNISEKQDLILPIWHNVSYKDVKEYSPSLADITALKSSEIKIEEIAEQLISLLRESSYSEIS